MRPLTSSYPSSAIAVRDGIRSRQFTAREIVTEALTHAEHLEPLGALVSVNAERALDEAAIHDIRVAHAADKAVTALPPLLGVPTAHKDLVAQIGHVTTHGSQAVPHIRATADDPIAAAVRHAGAISLGKTQVPEFGIAAYSENLIAPPARNPHDPTRTAGGSSGGSATAVATRLIHAAIASDGGGSIRIPAAACGIVGLKTTRGLIPADRARSTDNPFGFPDLTVSGPLARTAGDAALMLDAITGRWSEPTLQAVMAAEQLTGLRIGVSIHSPFSEWTTVTLSEDAQQALHRAAAALRDAGHTVTEAEISYTPGYADAFTACWSSRMARFASNSEALASLTPLAQHFASSAARLSSEDLHRAAAQLAQFATEAQQQWGAYDAVLTPALSFAPPHIDAFTSLTPEADYELQCQWASHTSMVNVAGNPAVTAPIFTNSSGLPFGVQLIGRHGSDALLLQLAEQLGA